MMLNVWGVIWRIQKKLIGWTKDNAQNGTPIPEQAKRMARMDSWLARECIPEPAMLFFMGAATLPAVWEIRFSRRKGQNTLTAKNAKTSREFAKKELDLPCELRDCFRVLRG